MPFYTLKLRRAQEGKPLGNVRANWEFFLEANAFGWHGKTNV